LRHPLRPPSLLAELVAELVAELLPDAARVAVPPPVEREEVEPTVEAALEPLLARDPASP
jgi:hypothetical protein